MSLIVLDKHSWNFPVRTDKTQVSMRQTHLAQMTLIRVFYAQTCFFCSFLMTLTVEMVVVISMQQIDSSRRSVEKL